MADLTSIDAPVATGVQPNTGPVAPAPQPAARPVMLVRYRPGVIGETTRTVHVVQLPTDEQAGAVSALCGTTLMHDDIETVSAGEGMPCTLCVVKQALSTSPAGESDADRADTAGLAAGGIAYQKWDWPVTRHHDQVRLPLHGEVSAMAISIPLGIQVTRILVHRNCAPAVLAHPYAPDHHIVLTGERYEVPLPWPGQVHRVTGFLLLPPTVTPRGPITWTRTPKADSLQLCREIDLFGALRTALNDPHAPQPR